MDRQETVELKHRLCNCLLRLDTIADRDTRNLYFAIVEEQFGQPLHARRYADAKHDTWSMVSGCLEHPGLLRSFADTIRQFNGESRTTIELQQLVDRVEPAHGMTLAERETLINTAKQVPLTQVISAYQTVAGTHPDLPTPDWTDPRSVVMAVERIGGLRDQSVPRQFADLLRPETPGPTERYTWDDKNTRNPEPYPTAKRPADSFRPEEPRPGVRTSRPPTSPPGAAEHHPTFRGGVPLRNRNFTGRQDLLRQMHRAFSLQTTGSVVPQVLHGPTGVGKTQVAVEYAHLHAPLYHLVWWISANHSNSIIASLCRLGDQLGFPPDTDPTQRAIEVIDSLSAAPYLWLLVYDNALDPHTVEPLVPSFGGHAIVTSRNGEWTTHWSTIEVESFDRHESIDLLQRRNPRSSREIANRLADLLGDLPLALDQAANFQAVTGMPIVEYLKLFSEQGLNLLDEGKPSDYPTALTTQLRTTFKSLREESPPAADLLGLFAYLGAEPLRAALLRRGHDTDIPQPLAGILGDPVQLARALRDLSRHGLVKIDLHEQRIQVHQLTQDILRASLTREAGERSRDNVHKILAVANPGDPDDQATWSSHREIGSRILPSDLINAKSDEARRALPKTQG